MMNPAPSAPQQKPKGIQMLSIRQFAHLAQVDLSLGDLTVLVGPQGVGKSLALQWLKVALDGKHVVAALHSAGHPTDRPEALMDLLFGSGMASAWKEGLSQVSLHNQSITLQNLSRIGASAEQVLFIPAHRSLLLADGWALPFQKLGAETPAVARLFSQQLFDQFNTKNAGQLFPLETKFAPEIQQKIDDAIFHGGRVGMEEDARQHTKRLGLRHGTEVCLPYQTWTAGQREFTPLMLGLYRLLLPQHSLASSEIQWVVIEEPEMGLHPKAITAVLLLVLNLVARGHRVVLATHSPHVLTLLWMMRRLQECGSSWTLVCDAFDLPHSLAMREMAETALTKNFKAHAFQFMRDSSQIESIDISSLDPDAQDMVTAEWGGLTEYASRFGAAVRQAVNESAT
ncbi:MAG: ATP-binding protein [Limnohabitans sp.]|nr:ATP-binding protein [Limnohabitans sp.]